MVLIGYPTKALEEIKHLSLTAKMASTQKTPKKIL